EGAEAHVELRERDEQARLIDLLRILRRRRAVARLEPALHLGLELDRLGLGRAGRAEEQDRDLAIDRVLLEEERELAALVDLDGVVEPAGVQLGGAEAVDALERTPAGEVE